MSLEGHPERGEEGPELGLSMSLWCLATGVATLGFMLYLPLGAIPALAAFTEDPWPLTLAMLLGAGISIRGAWTVRSAALVSLRRTLLLGAFLAFMGNVNYLHYVYYYSQTVPEAQGAPAVGAAAPPFEVADPGGGSWSLDAYAGTPLLLVFYRAHW